MIIQHAVLNFKPEPPFFYLQTCHKTILINFISWPSLYYSMGTVLQPIHIIGARSDCCGLPFSQLSLFLFPSSFTMGRTEWHQQMRLFAWIIVIEEGNRKSLSIVLSLWFESLAIPHTYEFESKSRVLREAGSHPFIPNTYLPSPSTFVCAFQLWATTHSLKSDCIYKDRKKVLHDKWCWWTVESKNPQIKNSY